MAAVVAALPPLPTQSITITKPTRPDTGAYTQSHTKQTAYAYKQASRQSESPRGTQIYIVIQAGSQLGCHSAIIPQTKNTSTSMATICTVGGRAKMCISRAGGSWGETPMRGARPQTSAYQPHLSFKLNQM